MREGKKENGLETCTKQVERKERRKGDKRMTCGKKEDREEEDEEEANMEDIWNEKKMEGN